jgi:hypothetical protein
VVFAGLSTAASASSEPSVASVSSIEIPRGAGPAATAVLSYAALPRSGGDSVPAVSGSGGDDGGATVAVVGSSTVPPPLPSSIPPPPPSAAAPSLCIVERRANDLRCGGERASAPAGPGRLRMSAALKGSRMDTHT